MYYCDDRNGSCGQTGIANDGDLMMPINELLGEGVQLMLFGMGVVFLFLGLLVAVITLISRIIQNIESRLEQPVSISISPEDELPEVVTNAVQRYRSDHPR